jgi:hypothetical protein
LWTCSHGLAAFENSYGVLSLRDIQQFELRLGFSLPDSYKDFLLHPAADNAPVFAVRMRGYVQKWNTDGVDGGRKRVLCPFITPPAAAIRSP